MSTLAAPATDLVTLLDDAGLTGLGGARFRTAVKVRAAQDAGAALVVNCCDGELGSAKDAFVVAEHLPELVRGARSVAGERVTYAAHRGSRTAQLLQAAGLAVLATPQRYVSSEETALVSLVHGGLARPFVKHRPVVLGATTADRDYPATVVLNAETVWRIDQIGAHGPAWFRSFGTPAEPGPRLVTVSGAGPVVVETQAGEPVASLLARAGVDPTSVAAVLVGGLSGAWLTASQALDLRWSSPDLLPHGATPGGTIAVVPHGACPLDTVAAHVRYAGGESAGQCGPCMFGVPALAQGLLDAIAGTGPTDDLARRLPLLAGRGACRFPDGVAGYVASVLRVFGPHLADHADHRCAVSKELA